MTKKPRGVRYRSRAVAGDVAALEQLVAATQVFYPEERAIALELLVERLEQVGISANHPVAV